MAANKREIRKLLLEVVELGKKAEKTLATPESLQTFIERCNTNKTIPKFLHDLENVGVHAKRVKESLESAKLTKAAKATKPVSEFNPMDYLASFAGKAIAAALQVPSQKGGALRPRKKKAIPAALRKQVWNHYIGAPVGETKCLVCRHNTIDKLGFEAGHVVPECAGGTTTLPNLRPICGDCNRSMGAMNMNEYSITYYGHPI